MSIRFRPNRCASTDHAPGPSIASAAPKDSLFARYVLDRANQRSPFSSGLTIPLWPELDTTANHFAIQERHFFSPAVINLASGPASLGPSDLLPFSLIQNKFAESDDVI